LASAAFAKGARVQRAMSDNRAGMKTLRMISPPQS
jgi:hypothetical protein